MNCSGSFGTQHANTDSVQVSSKVVSVVTADSAKAASISVGANGFKDAFAAASEAAGTHKSQSSAKQADEKKSTRDRQPGQDATSPALTAPDTKTSLPVTVGVVAPPVLAVRSGTNDRGTQDSRTSDSKANGAVFAISPSSGGNSATAVADEITIPGDETASLGEGTGAVANQAASVENKTAIAEDTNGTSTVTDLPDAARTFSNGVPASNPGAPVEATGESGGVGAEQSIKAAAMPVLPSASDFPAAREDGPTGITKSTATAKDDGKSGDSVQSDAENQDVVLANTLPLTMPASAQPVVPATQSMPKVEAAQTGPALDSGFGSAVALKSGSKQAVAGKDRAAISDVKSKGKSEDEDTQSSSTAADASFATKIPVVAVSVDHQAASSHSGSAGADAAQQAVQASITNAAPANASASQILSASDSTHGAAQGTAPAQTASATQAQELPTLNSAHLVQSMGQSEMKLGMHSAEFGSISISTSLTHQALSAQISISHSALGQALAAHLPSIEQKLGSAYGLQARVEVKDSSSSSAGGSGRPSQDSRQPQTSGSTSAGSSIAGIGIAAAPATTTTSLLAGSSRLDIRI